MFSQSIIEEEKDDLEPFSDDYYYYSEEDTETDPEGDSLLDLEEENDDYSDMDSFFEMPAGYSKLTREQKKQYY
jgi:hypothetical protein